MEQIIDINTDGCHLSRHRGFLLVEKDRTEIGRIPLDQISAVIVHAHGITYSSSLLVALLEHNALLVLCGNNHQPKGLLWSVDGHIYQGARMRAQVAAKPALQKRLWREIIRRKVAMQGAVLASFGHPSVRFQQLVKEVRAGDPSNIEAQAARLYWPLLMGKDFRRNPDLPDVNSLLNYGYSVLRATAARAIMASGLHPTFGIFHGNRSNSFALADDVMEPYRPIVDATVCRYVQQHPAEINPEVKRMLARLIALDMPHDGQISPLSLSLQKLATSLAHSFEAEKVQLSLPDTPGSLLLFTLGSKVTDDAE